MTLHPQEAQRPAVEIQVVLPLGSQQECDVTVKPESSDYPEASSSATMELFTTAASPAEHTGGPLLPDLCCSTDTQCELHR